MTAGMPGRTIILNADDLGLCASVNTAIFDVFKAGNLSSATLMVNMPGTQDAVARLPDHPGLAVGLHFCITEGAALTGASSLTDSNGTFLDRATQARRALQGRMDAAHVRAEFEAQLAKARALGVHLTHADSHQHVMMLPPVFDAVRPVIERERLAVRMVDPPRGAVGGALARPKKALKQWLNQRFAARNRARTSARTNDALVSIHDLDSTGPYTAATYRNLLASVPVGEVVEVMVHPYLLGPDVFALYPGRAEAKAPFFARCAAEHAALSKVPVFPAERRINFGDL